MEIKLTILGDPKPQKRHRSVNMGGFIRQYDPSATEKANFLSIVQYNAPKVPLSVPLAVCLKFYFTRPKSHFKTGKNSHVMKDNAPSWHTGRPDVDNLAKKVLDALNKVYWKDDSYIADCWIIKQYDDKPRTEIEITLL